ncbi:alpha/beta hydrolase [Paraburkholderia graminis]|uniref:Carboxylesterase n=1 Tax=Paraburkholderia graminis TaxID=60548 RepID=A0ABD5CTQ1_9BURK|nr:alpha/beta fold hydrolase [Paraburkholderia graminis]MDR6208100.1 carboxylesterase [Paraburkholderia graminis]
MSSRTGALLIHGLGGTQYDLGSMHKQLKRSGIETHSLTLPGHGMTPHALREVRAEDWIEAATRKYRELVQQYDTLHVIGMCMGALLATIVCAREQHRSGALVALAPPVYIDGWSTPWYRTLRYAIYLLPILSSRIRVEEGDPYGIKNESVRNVVKAKLERGESFHYRWVPLSCIREVDRLRRGVRRCVAEVACPVLVVHAREDELTSLRSARFIARQAPNVRVEVLENSYHMVCVDNDRAQVARSVLEFIAHAARPRASTDSAAALRHTATQMSARYCGNERSTAGTGAGIVA